MKQRLIRNGLKVSGWSDEAIEFLIERSGSWAMAHNIIRYWDTDSDDESPKRKDKISYDLRRQVFERDAYRCVSCKGWHDLTCDHIIPESKGGLTISGNLQTMCRVCNSRKATR